MQKKLVYCGALPSLAHVDSCGEETCPPPPKELTGQAIGDSVNLQLSKGMDLDSTHLVDSWAAQSGIFGYRTEYVHILYFSASNTVSWYTPQMIYPRSIDCF
jgi:hypothetical protein